MLFSDMLYERTVTPRDFLTLFRTVEDLGTKIGDPILVYYSNQSAGRLLPKGPRFRDLLREAACVSIFSFEGDGPKDEFTFLMLTKKGGVFIDGEYVGVTADVDNYSCHGSVNYQQSLDKFNSLKNRFRELEEAEAERLTKIVAQIGAVNPDLQQFDQIVRSWNSYN